MDYDDATELGRHVVFVRDKADPKKPVPYVIDPWHALEPKNFIRNDFQVLFPQYWIGVRPMDARAFKGGK